jgi:hypothetical protein
MIGTEGRLVELPMRKAVKEQVVGYFDKDNVWVGRSFDACENFVNMTLQNAPRKPGTMRVALCPVVKCQRKKLEFTSTNKELGEVAYVQPEALYDVNLKVDVPPDQFLIVAPSSESTWPTSLGNTFFVADGPAERMENVLLIVPKQIRVVETLTPKK